MLAHVLCDTFAACMLVVARWIPRSNFASFFDFCGQGDLIYENGLPTCTSFPMGISACCYLSYLKKIFPTAGAEFAD